MRGTYRLAEPFPVPTVSLIRQPFGLPPSPRGKAKDQPSVKHTSAAERRKKCHVSYRRTRAFSPYQRAVDLLLKRESASKLAQETFLWGSGAAFLFLGKRNVPQKHARLTCKHLTFKRPNSSARRLTESSSAAPSAHRRRKVRLAPFPPAGKTPPAPLLLLSPTKPDGFAGDPAI